MLFCDLILYPETLFLLAMQILFPPHGLANDTQRVLSIRTQKAISPVIRML